MKSQTGIPAHSNVAVQLHSYVQSVKKLNFYFCDFSHKRRGNWFVRSV